MANLEILEEQLAKNTSVDLKLLKDLQEILVELERLGTESSSSFRLAHPFDGQLATGHLNDQRVGEYSANCWSTSP